MIRPRGGDHTVRLHGDGHRPDHRTVGNGDSTRVHGDGHRPDQQAAANRDDVRTSQIHGDGHRPNRRTAGNRDDDRSTRIRQDGRHGSGNHAANRAGGSGARRGRTGGRLRTALRLAARASRRLVRAAGHASTASVATTGSPARPVPVRPTRATARWRYAARRGPGAPVVVIATLMVLIMSMLGVERVTGVTVLPDRLFAGIRPPPKRFPVLPASPPTDITISKLDLRAPVHRVGIARDGTIAVPEIEKAGEAGWYDQGPTPGQYGPAVIVGHVDTTTGPAVFHDLKRLGDGDRVEVTREDHSVAVFEVTSVQRYDKERLPADEIFGDFSRPNLRLITCGGRWVGGATGYADNLVVYASLVDSRGP